MRVRQERLVGRYVFWSLLTFSGALAVYACSSDSADPDGAADETRSITTDGGVLYADGGVVYTDGGVVYIDGGFQPFDAGPSTCKGAGEALGTGIYGCFGSVPYATRDSVCKSGCRA